MACEFDYVENATHKGESNGAIRPCLGAQEPWEHVLESVVKESRTTFSLLLCCARKMLSR